MNKSIFWAKLLGLYSIILAIWTFHNIKGLHTTMLALENNAPLLMVMGLFTLFLGLSIIVSHGIWKGWPIIVTLVGYWITIKGLVLLFFPEWINKIITFWQGKNMIYTPIPALVIGLILLFCGFFCHKKA